MPGRTRKVNGLIQGNVMRLNHKTTAGVMLLAALFMTAVISTAWMTTAQDESSAPPAQPSGLKEIVSAEQCSAPLGAFWLSASEACVGKPFGFVCNGGMGPQVEPSGPVHNSMQSLGALVETNIVDSLRTSSIMPTGENGGIAWLRVTTPNTLVQYSALLVGDVEVDNVTLPDFPAWQSFVVQTRNPESRCENAPHSSLVIQSLPNQSARLVVNGVSLDLQGTVVIQTEGDTLTHFMTIAGELRVIVTGQQYVLFTGQELGVPYASGDFSRPIGQPPGSQIFREERAEHLPVVLFDRPVLVPQAGYAVTNGPVNMRNAPSLDAGLIVQVPAGERLTVLGRNPAGDWLHVRRPTGQSGWMFRELLGGQIGEIDNVYEATPQPLQRMGQLGEIARVNAPNGVTMRTAPLASFAALNTLQYGAETKLMARSPYSPWVKVDASGQVGWVPLIAMDTQAIIEALEIDFDVPPPPAPTRIPGSFGNAFPDPNCYPNC
jgi:uncharacterized protein YraI